MLSAPFVLLHVPQGVTVGEYLFRVLVYVLAFTGVCAATYWGLLAGEIVRSRLTERL